MNLRSSEGEGSPVSRKYYVSMGEKDMKKHGLAFVTIAFVLCALAGQSQNPQQTGGSTSPFAGRWEIQMISPPDQPEPFAIIEIEQGVSGITWKLIALADPTTGTSVKLGEISEKEGLLSFTIETSMMEMSLSIKFQGKKVAGHLEGNVDMTVLQATWTGQPTTKDKFEKPEDQKALRAAQMKPPAERAEALKQFIENFPDSSLKDQANYLLALSLQKPEEKAAALRKFIGDFPNSSLKEQASLQIAQNLQDPLEKKAALSKFLADFPTSRMKDQVEYQLIRMIDDPDERRAAQEKFVKDYPKSMSAQNVYRTLLDLQLQTKPVDEAKVNGIIDGFINSTPDPSDPSNAFTIMRADALNTIADRLMERDILLDRALELIQEAVGISEKLPPQFRATIQTTLGQVHFKRKEYDEAEKELKKAVEAAGRESIADAQMYLGKIYEARNDDDAALDAYFKAASSGSSGEIKSSLERAYHNKYGSLDGLEEKLDAIYLARPKPFDPGHYAATGKESGRVVLAELFTGSECPPCVAADQAFDGLGERYDRNTVAILVYHLHIPGPDPMTNPDTERRAKYYQVGSTPTAVVDGLDIRTGGGSTAQAAMVFNDYNKRIEPRIAKLPEATFSNIQAKVEGQTVSVSGEVELGPEGTGNSERVRIRIALVQEVIRYTGGNGVRFHNFVVRKLMGSPEGMALGETGAKTRFSESENIQTLGDSYREYLTKYENEIAEKRRPGFKFPEKLDRIDPARLVIVAFLQDDVTKEILQARFVKPGQEAPGY